MKTMKLALLGTVAMIGLSTVAATAAHAEVQDYRGFYLGGFGGLSWENGQEYDTYIEDSATELNANEVEFRHGYLVGGEAGWSWGSGLLTGLEYNYKRNTISNVDAQTPGSTPTRSGDVELHTIMAKATYELPFEMFGFIRPYAGAGIGPGYAKFDRINLGGFTVDDHRYLLSYEGFAGLAFNLTPRLEATAEYRYIATDDFGADTDVQGVKATVNQGAHNALIGLRYQFGEPVQKAAPAAPAAPAPAPVVAAAPAPRPVAPVVQPPAVPQTYIVFFDFDKSILTPEAQKVLERAAQDVRVGKGARIQVVGHADRSGSNSYNQRLSERRAAVVKTELVRLGVNNGQIATRGAGELEPRVPTADGVREAQNRRAEIIFQ